MAWMADYGEDMEPEEFEAYQSVDGKIPEQDMKEAIQLIPCASADSSASLGT